MADYLPAFQDEWMAAINAVWPEILLPASSSASNFFTAIQALKTNIEQRIEFADPALPYCFIAFGTFPPGGVNLDRNDKNAAVTIFYIDSEANGATQVTINSKLQAMDEYLRTRNTTTFCLMDDAFVDSSDLNPVNQTLSTMSQIRVKGGTISWNKVYTVALT